MFAATFTDSVDFGGGLLSGFAADSTVAKFDASGEHLFSRRFGDGGLQTFSGAAVDPLGNVLLTGIARSAVDYGGGPLTGAGDDDIAVVKLSP